MKNLFFLVKSLDERKLFSLGLHFIIFVILVAIVSIMVWVLNSMDSLPFIAELLVTIFFAGIIFWILSYFFPSLEKKNRIFLKKGEETEEERRKRLGQYNKLPLNLK